MRRLRMRSASVAVIVAVAFASSVLQAFHSDLHIQTTLALALAAGWPWSDALVIAAADQGVDENDETVAGLEINTVLNVAHQAAKNYEFHCFSRSDDRAASQRDTINADVVSHLTQLERDVRTRIQSASRTGNNVAATEALIATGVYLHCLQDSWSHSAYGATYFGHSWADLLRRSPDDPGRRPPKTAHALEAAFAKLTELSQMWQRRGTASAAQKTVPLVTALTDRRLLPLVLSFDQSLALAGARTVRSAPRNSAWTPGIDCTADAARHWIYALLRDESRLKSVPDRAIHPFVHTAGFCQYVFEQPFRLKPGERTYAVVEPTPLYPKLTIRGTAQLVNTDGSYVSVNSGTFDHQLEQASGRSQGTAAGGCAYDMDVTVRNVGGRAPEADLLVTVFTDTSTTEGPASSVRVVGLGDQQTFRKQFRVEQRQPCPAQAGYVATVQAPRDVEQKPGWGDRDISNNSRLGAIQRAPPAVALRH